MLLDSAAEVFILDTAFANKVGCHVDTSQSEECVGIGESVMTLDQDHIGRSADVFLRHLGRRSGGPRSDPGDGFHDAGRGFDWIWPKANSAYPKRPEFS
ncbi:hypothetical protein GQ600_18526 [Phytophthora cactorum]|nr:hypothetical protein GQ600_18526 [Phytophthora cactorum]